MADSFLGQISLFPYPNFSLRNWHPCDGSLLSIAQNSALFSLIGTTYGGDGQQNFGLPDLRGRVPVGSGAGPGRSPYAVGQFGGAEQVTLSVGNLAAHTHAASLQVTTTGRGVSPVAPATGNYLYTTQTDPASGSPATTALGGVAVQPAGSNAPFSVIQPYLSMNYYICLEGIYPSRN